MRSRTILSRRVKPILKLVLQQFANRSDTAVAQMVDVVYVTFVVVQADQDNQLQQRCLRDSSVRWRFQESDKLSFLLSL